MKFKTEALVTGVKFFSDTVEGKAYDNTTVFIIQDLDESQKNAKGQAGDMYKSDSSDLFRKMKDFAFPVNCELLLEQVTNGKVTKTKVLEVRPLVAAPVHKVN